MIGRLRTVVIDCPDPRALAGFYAELLGLPADYANADDEDGWVTVGGGPGELPRLAFQRAPGLREPRWPDPERPQQFHLDITVEKEEIESAEARVLELGASRLPGSGDGWRVYADPAGHPFCLCWDG